MLSIDGSFGEGGGQILRSSLALSMVMGVPFRIRKIRAGRKKPGLMRQHLTAVQAAKQVSNAKAEGVNIGSTELTFEPGPISPGQYDFAVGTAGSTTLVLQTVLPVLLCASGPSQLTFEGGTHNPFAPPFDFLQKAFIPIVNRMGPQISATLDRPGFYPAGGGKFSLTIQPIDKLKGVDFLESGRIVQQRARAIVANLSRHIAEREIKVIHSQTGWNEDCFTIEETKKSSGPGNIVMIEVQSEHLTEVFTGFGQKGIRAETVAEKALQAYQRYQQADVPVGEYLADQIMLLLAIACSGSFITLPLTNHSTTHIELIRKFLDINVSVERLDRERYQVRINQ
ncbi:MAG: RNA 3'-terminal phosphate cyclase [Planctomycetota bacterium]|nr:MAG: RNA 3'-terminal phosphate cyclase [Planctomycetota bacterium]